MDSIEYYDKYANVYYENTVNLSMKEVLDQFLDYLPENADVLDLGCGSGRDGLYLERAGCYVTLMDGSKEMCRLAEINTDKEVLNITFEDLDFDQVFDGIWACASLLHVEEKDMDRILKKVIASLVPGGVLYMSFKHGIFEGFRNNRLFHDYTEKTLYKLIKRHSQLEIIEIFKTGDLRSNREGDFWINAFVRKRKKDSEMDE